MYRKLKYKPSPIYWVVNSIMWSSFAVAWYFLHTSIKIVAPDLALFNAIQVFILCFLLSFASRQLIYALKLFEAKSVHAFLLGLTFFSVLGLAASVIFQLNLAFYYIVNGHASEIVFFFNDYILVAIPISLTFIIWGLTLQAATNLSHYKKVEDDNEEISHKLKEAQLNSLIGQLNPHFLFNGLNNIRSLMLEDVAKAREMITSLSEILRYSLLSHKTQQVKLQEELDVVEAYIELASIQYESRFDHKQNISESALNRLIPPMSIQLLIENAIKHGIDKTLSGGVLELSIQIDQAENLIVEVINSGEYRPNVNKNNNTNTGMGLTNIQDRIDLIYGKRASLVIKQSQDLVVATLKLPKGKKEEVA